jgi:type VI secretion system (T6SS) effector TldE1-like protein
VRGGQIRVASTRDVNCGLLVGGSLRLIAAGTIGPVVALALGLWGEIPTACASIQQEPSFEEHWKAFGLAEDFHSVEAVNHELLSQPDMGQRAKSASGLRADASLTPTEVTESNSIPDADDLDHTAIYDIAAHTVYLPDGKRLEAHSGLGRLLDNPHYVNVKDRGPTPPNIYDLSLREERFHGVRAIRLNPVDSSKTFGRQGLLAHSYMLGRHGHSNGCVAFSHYPRFLNAYLSGEINRLVVVEHLATTPRSKPASRRLPEAIRALLGAGP